MSDTVERSRLWLRHTGLRHIRGARSKPQAVYAAEVLLLVMWAGFALIFAVTLPRAAWGVFQGEVPLAEVAPQFGLGLLALIASLWAILQLMRGAAWAWWAWVAINCLPCGLGLAAGEVPWWSVIWGAGWVAYSLFDPRLRAYLRGPREPT